ncbi:cell envelope integrity protein TolA [Salmonella enterica subsp. diarizonae]|nr:cell envelope integrity protein TolA [Salmonella enterica subsp. diarizonae]ELS5095818.1 cell envelope integrity protein TolA [Salmonella enterica]
MKKTIKSIGYIAILIAFTTKAENMTIEQKEITNYAYKMKTTIESRFPNQEKYTGKTCKIRITLEKNGTISKAAIEGGDASLCKAAQKATIGAKLGIPTQKQYEVFKNAPLDFKP